MIPPPQIHGLMAAGLYVGPGLQGRGSSCLHWYAWAFQFFQTGMPKHNGEGSEKEEEIEGRLEKRWRERNENKIAEKIATRLG